MIDFSNDLIMSFCFVITFLMWHEQKKMNNYMTSLIRVNDEMYRLLHAK